MKSLFLLLPLVLLACGGDNGGTETSNVSSSTGGTSQGGTGGSQAAGSGGSGQAGASAGTSAGGTSAGGASGGAGGAGAGGAENCCATVKCGGEGAVCVEGECFNLKAGECFTQDDCGGAACEGVVLCPCGGVCKQGTKPGLCQGAVADWKKCGAPGECTLAANNCCGVCGKPEAANVDAVNDSKLAEHFATVCDDPNPACPECVSQNNPDLLAICALGPGECHVLEVSKSVFSECEKDDDCLLRPPSCCYCEMVAENVVALSVKLENSYNAELECDAVDCAPCPNPIEPPPGLTAICDPATKHCRISP